jgi:hypothetical protein
MHPLLVDRRRLFAYLAVWELLGGLLALLLVLSGGFSWMQALTMAIPLAALYSFVCLGAFWVCHATPLRRSGLVRAAGAQVAAALLSASFWLLASRGWAAILERSDLVAG